MSEEETAQFVFDKAELDGLLAEMAFGSSADLDVNLRMYRTSLLHTGYRKMLRLLRGSNDDVEVACKVGHLLKEVGLI